MNRLIAFRALIHHAYYGRFFQRLKPDDISSCESFIVNNDVLPYLEFERQIQRWMLDSNKPRNYPLMCDLLIAANSRSVSGICASGSKPDANRRNPHEDR